MKIGEIILGIFICTLVILAFGTLIYSIYVEYSLESHYNSEFKLHNGTCYPVDKLGLVRQCSYTDDVTSIVNSNSQCYINNISVNCSELK